MVIDHVTTASDCAAFHGSVSPFVIGVLFMVDTLLVRIFIVVRRTVMTLLAGHVSLITSLISKASLRMRIIVIEAIISPTVDLQRLIWQVVSFGISMMNVIMLKHPFLIQLIWRHHIISQLVVETVVLSLIELGWEVLIVVIMD
jgi:hypothetical protein